METATATLPLEADATAAAPIPLANRPPWFFYEEHPAATIFPVMDDSELEELTENIRQNGFDPKHPIVLHEGKVLDGRNRLEVCRELWRRGQLSFDPPFVEWDGDDAVAWVLSENLYRRHLTASQRSAVATDLERLFQADAEARRIANLKRGDTSADVAKMPAREEQGRSRDKAAEKMSVSPRYVQDAKALREADPETFEQVKAGKVSLSDAKKKVKTAAAKSDDATVAERKEKGVRPPSAPELGELEAALAAFPKTKRKLLKDRQVSDDHIIRAARLEHGYMRKDFMLAVEAGPEAREECLSRYEEVERFSLAEESLRRLGRSFDLDEIRQHIATVEEAREMVLACARSYSRAVNRRSGPKASERFFGVDHRWSLLGEEALDDFEHAARLLGELEDPETAARIPDPQDEEDEDERDAAALSQRIAEEE
jgi:hypothetical protein